jgi:hypothetical protein
MLSLKYSFPNDVTANTKCSAVHVTVYAYEIIFLTRTKKHDMMRYIYWAQFVLHGSWNCSPLIVIPGCHCDEHSFILLLIYFPIDTLLKEK